MLFVSLRFHFVPPEIFIIINYIFLYFVDKEEVLVGKKKKIAGKLL